MAFSYRPVDRSQPFLLPPDMREWLPASHLVWFVLEVVARVDTSALHARHGNDGPGRRAYDPDMMLGLLIYAYCTGVRSSRRIERLCVVDVAYRVMAANSGPDHTTIARFRQGYNALAQSLFVEVLELCAAAGLATVGVVAIDGTKMGADASLGANRSREQIAAEVAAMFDHAERVDSDEDRLFGDANGDELPAELIDPRSRKARLDAALAVLEAQSAARREDQAAARAAKAATGNGAGGRRGRPATGAEVIAAEAALAKARETARAHRADLDARAEERGDRRGRPRAHPEGVFVAKAEARLARAQQRAETRSEEPAKAPKTPPRANITDPDSRIMSSTKGWIQGYNAQAAANAHGIILAATVTQDHNDIRWCVPMMRAIRTNLDAAGIAEPIGTVLLDAGYCSEANLTAPGPDRLIATTKSWKLRRQARQNGFTQGDPPPDATPIDAMEHRLRTQEGTALYTQRQHTIEPIFGHTKANRGYRRFTRRGLPAVNNEWQLIATTHNLQRLHNHPPTPKTP
jgi:transposase